MVYRLTYCVHRSKNRACETLASRSNGKYSTLQPEWQSSAPDFIPREVSFKELNDVNSFIYHCYNTFGLYFFIEELVRTSRPF